MPSDRSRTSSDPRYQYKGVVTQQGRVIVDRDFNALQDIVNGRTEVDAADVIGPCGTPDNGFAISLPDTSPPSPPLWSPPAPLPPPFLHPFDFLIAPGTMYVGGQRAVLPERQAGKAISYSYFDQPDFIRPDDPLPVEGSPLRQSAIELVYLHLFEQEVSAVEDPDLLDAALGGVDTTQRLRLMRRVQRLPVQNEDCVSAWAEATALWLKQKGLYLDPETLRLVPQVQLRVGFTQEQAVTGACDPVASGGYLGADNQLIRVQISDAGVPGDATQPAKLLWGYDNASFLYRVAAVVSNGSMLQLARDPPDQFHIPQTGQAVEILKAAAILESEPDETDPTGRRTIVRCVAEATGVIRTLAQPYGPASSSDTTKYIVLDRALPSDYANDTNPLFLRVWQAELPFNQAGDTVELSDPSTNATTGIKITLSTPKGEALTAGAFWMIAARPSTPQAVYPERLLTAPQPPDGPRQWACPLAVIDWAGTYAPILHDCRCLFDNLVTLTKRKGGCCTVNVSPKDLTATHTLQAVIDKAAGLAGVVTVCLSPGVYRLNQPLRLNSMHSSTDSKMIIDGCGGGVIIQGDPRADLKAFSDGLLVLSEASAVTLRGLQLQAPAASLPANLLPEIPALAMIGVRAAYAGNLTVEDCSFLFSPPASAVPATLIFGTGIFLQGDCSGLVVRGCSFASTISPTLTPLPSARTVAAEAASSPRAWDLFAGDLRAPLKAIIAQAAIRPRILEGAAAVAPFAAIVGCLAASGFTADLTEAGGQEPICRLGDATICDNGFNNLTLPVTLNGVDTRTVRLQDNYVTECLDGFWLWLNGFVPPTGTSEAKDFNEVSGAILFEEYFLIYFLGSRYPLPLPATPPVIANGTITPASLFLRGNQIEMKPSGNQGSTAIMILANRSPVQGKDTSASLIISDNRLRSQTSQVLAPTALLVLADSERCTITGNLIFNEEARLTEEFLYPASLFIIPNSSTRGGLLAVVGNVLLGRTDLDKLTRTDAPAPFDTWVRFNSLLRAP
jgi:hypothetical protein